MVGEVLLRKSEKKTPQNQKSKTKMQKQPNKD